MSLPKPIIGVLDNFRPAFSAPTWRKASVLVVGSLLAHGRRMVTTALRQMGYADEPHFSHYHHVLNRARWSAFEVSRRLLQLLVATFVAADGGVEVVIDETLERRWGRQITKRGHYRDPLLSSKGQSVSNSGLRWVVVAVLVRLPWTKRTWALPFLSLLATPPSLSEARGERHKTVGDMAQQAVAVLRRWLPTRRLKLIGDGAYSSIALGLACVHHRVTLIAPLRRDANLYAPVPPRDAGQRGRPAVKGAALPKLNAVLTDPSTVWQSVSLPWYEGPARTLQVCTGTAVWYHTGQTPLPIRWVLTRDPDGQHDPKAYFSTDQEQTALDILTDYMKRWPLEVTFEESRAHLGLETQRQWSDAAIERTTPCLLGLYSLVALFGQALHPDGQVPTQRTVWYAKPVPTFSDVLATVRRHLWGNFDYPTGSLDPDVVLIPRDVLARLAYTVCY
jgi:hypothetical protein